MENDTDEDGAERTKKRGRDLPIYPPNSGKQRQTEPESPIPSPKQLNRTASNPLYSANASRAAMSLPVRKKEAGAPSSKKENASI
jgi:hypothetical protein